MPRVAVITGANGGIGRAVLNQMVADGGVVAALDRDPGVRTLTASRVHPIVVDLSDVSAAEAAAAAAVRELGPVDVLVNNAGVMHKKPLTEHSLDDWEL